MCLYELLEVLNDNAVIILYDASQNVISIYDGKNDLDVDFITYNNDEIYAGDFMVTDVFPDNSRNINAIGIEIDMNISDYKECR